MPDEKELPVTYTVEQFELFVVYRREWQDYKGVLSKEGDGDP